MCEVLGGCKLHLHSDNEAKMSGRMLELYNQPVGDSLSALTIGNSHPTYGQQQQQVVTNLTKEDVVATIAALGVRKDQKARLIEEYKNMPKLFVTLGENKLCFEDDVSKASPSSDASSAPSLPNTSLTWTLQESEASSYRSQITALRAQCSAKDSDHAALGSECAALSKQLNAMSFKMEVLLDLLAGARADEKRSLAKYEREKAAKDEYRRELERVYTIAQEKGVDIDLHVNMRDGDE